MVIVDLSILCLRKVRISSRCYHPSATPIEKQRLGEVSSKKHYRKKAADWEMSSKFYDHYMTNEVIVNLKMNKLSESAAFAKAA